MDEIKPVAWLCVWNGEEGECTWAQYHGKFDPLPEEWDETPDEIEPYYDQQAIDTLRAEVESLRAWQAEARAAAFAECERTDRAEAQLKEQELTIQLCRELAGGTLRMGQGLIAEYQARAERAEAEAEALRSELKTLRSWYDSPERMGQ